MLKYLLSIMPVLFFTTVAGAQTYEESIFRNDPKFSFEAAGNAYQMGVAPTLAGLVGVWTNVGAVNHPGLNAGSDGYWPDGKATWTGHAGHYYFVYTFASFTDAFGNAADSIEQAILGAETGKKYQGYGPYSGAIDKDGYTYFIAGSDEYCGNVVTCKMVNNNQMLLCASKVHDARNVCNSYWKNKILRYSGYALNLPHMDM